jgi:hypothetical protein
MRATLSRYSNQLMKVPDTIYVALLFGFPTSAGRCRVHHCVTPFPLPYIHVRHAHRDYA